MDEKQKDKVKFWGTAAAVFLAALLLDTVHLKNGTLPLLDSSLAKLAYLVLIIAGLTQIAKKRAKGWSLLAAYCLFQGMGSIGIVAYTYLILAAALLITHWKWRKPDDLD